MVELHQMLYEKNIHKDFSDYNYYCKNGNIYHRCDIINNNVNNEKNYKGVIKDVKNYKGVIKDVKNKLFRIGNIIINKIF
jgi:hypothetical protein